MSTPSGRPVTRPRATYYNSLQNQETRSKQHCRHPEPDTAGGLALWPPRCEWAKGHLTAPEMQTRRRVVQVGGRHAVRPLSAFSSENTEAGKKEIKGYSTRCDVCRHPACFLPHGLLHSYTSILAEVRSSQTSYFIAHFALCNAQLSTDGRQAHDRALDLTCHRGNAAQNHSGRSPHSGEKEA